MSEKITMNFFLNQFHKIYPKNNITILKWNGYTKPLNFLCDVCGEEHHISDARQLLNKKLIVKKMLKIM